MLRTGPASRPALDNHQTPQPEMNLYDTTDSYQPPLPDTNVYETVPEDTITHPPGGEHVYYNSIEQTVVLPGGEHVYYNEQSGARAVKDTRQKNQQTSPDVALDELYSTPNKQSKPENDSEDYNYVWTTGGSGGAGGSGGETNAQNQDLEYVDIDHSGNPNKRSQGINPSSPGVTYTEVQRKKDAATDQQVETPSDSNMQMVKNELYN
ncbi:hypothetical protein NP493_180g07090 [Ridgeia piscesae]|uniref:Uncharacterized protein n=1 Tax=Ridgeia piscesae TaxID=27915 RepID=A0AAD9P2P3_RIDPI|nr:hypothetical protein NP493_180g07090 [Ridgeia piscesae]